MMRHGDPFPYLILSCCQLAKFRDKAPLISYFITVEPLTISITVAAEKDEIVD